MAIHIIYETHSTSLDNEAGLASGHFDVDLSPTGEHQAESLGARHAKTPLAAIYHADQLRAHRTVSIAFPDTPVPVVEDARLRECDYGDLTRAPVGDIDVTRGDYVETPYPGGESYRDTSRRIGAFLDDLKQRHGDGDTVLVIGNRAVQYGLEYWLNNVPLHQAVAVRLKWQPGWCYQLA